MISNTILQILYAIEDLPERVHGPNGGKLDKNPKPLEGDFKYDIVIRGNKVVGEIELKQLEVEIVELTWINVYDDYRGKGIATRALYALFPILKDNGYSTVQLDCPGNAPDARYIYEKLGFKAGKTNWNCKPYWKGLTRMTKRL